MKLIKKRTSDWWFFTLLPLMLFILIFFLVRADSKVSMLVLLTQQFYFYSVILSSTEIGLRFKLNQDMEEENKFKNSWQGIFILIFSSFLLGVSFFREDIFNNYRYYFFITSLIFTIGSIWLTNQNEYSGVGNFNFREQRNKKTEEFSKRVKNSTEPYKEVIID